jgi:hypothetical protein
LQTTPDALERVEDAEVDVPVSVVLRERVAGVVDVDSVMSVLVRVVLDQQVTCRSCARVDSIEGVRADLVVLHNAATRTSSSSSSAPPEEGGAYYFPDID